MLQHQNLGPTRPKPKTMNAATAFAERRPLASSSRTTRTGRNRTQSDTTEWNTEYDSRSPPSSFQRGLRYVEAIKYPHELSFKCVSLLFLAIIASHCAHHD